MHGACAHFGATLTAHACTSSPLCGGYGFNVRGDKSVVKLTDCFGDGGRVGCCAAVLYAAPVAPLEATAKDTGLSATLEQPSPQTLGSSVILKRFSFSLEDWIERDQFRIPFF